MIRILIATVGLAGSMAIAQACPAHDAHASVDTKMTVASIQSEPAPMSTAQSSAPQQPAPTVEEKK